MGMPISMRNDDWGMAVDLAATANNATEALMWLYNGGDPPNLPMLRRHLRLLEQNMRLMRIHCSRHRRAQRKEELKKTTGRGAP